jgi:hypothetical protein
MTEYTDEQLLAVLEYLYREATRTGRTLTATIVRLDHEVRSRLSTQEHRNGKHHQDT